jgi:hypothetical protein
MSIPRLLRRTAVLASTGVLVAAIPPSPVQSPGAVRGQVAIQERPGDKTEDLGNTIVYLELPAGVKPKLTPTPTSIVLQSRQFAPHVRVVAAGTKIEFPNQDPFSHNVFSKAKEGPFDTDSYGRGKKKDNVFKQAGVYPLFCNVHPRMTAFVLALSTPYFAQAGADGRFTIDNVPPGKYVLHVWHERAPEQTAEVTVAQGGLLGLKYQLDGRNYKYVQHKNKAGKEYANLGDIY